MAVEGSSNVVAASSLDDTLNIEVHSAYDARGCEKPDH